MKFSRTAFAQLARGAILAMVISVGGCTGIGDRSTQTEETWTHPLREKSLMSPTGIDPKARDIERNLGVF